MENPTHQDIQNVKRTLRYLKGTLNYGLFYPATPECEIKAYADSDYAGDLVKRKSTTGYLIFFKGGLVAWNSHLQSVTALSSMEAEYIASAECCKELKYLKTLTEELCDKTVPATLYADNQNAIRLIETAQMGRGSKHIEVRYHYISEQFKDGVFSIEYIPTEHQLADFLTKPLTCVKFENFRDAIMTAIE